MGSARLPGKVLKMIGSKPLLGHVFFRLRHLGSRSLAVVATGDDLANDVIEEFCAKNGVQCFRGSESNVLDRYYKCAVKYGFKQIVRLTADNPFVDIEELDVLIKSHLETGADYSQSFSALPLGIGAEIFTFEALERSWRKGDKPNQIEHVNEYIWDNPKEFRINVFENVAKGKRHPEISLTVDTEEDYRKACFIAENVESEFISTEETIKLCSQFA